jgi:transcriptional regulator
MAAFLYVGLNKKLTSRNRVLVKYGRLYKVGNLMKANHKRLWRILLDKYMKKKELSQIAWVSTYNINKLNKNENVTVEVLGKICKAFGCTLD